MRCTEARCPSAGQLLDVSQIELEATDDTPPTITPASPTDNLADVGGKWVRGIWDASFTADSQAGVCQAYVAVNGVFYGGESTTETPSTGSWTQCGNGAGTLGGSGASSVSATLDTTRYPNGPLSLRYYAADAAKPANIAAPTFDVNVDNTPVGLALSGPTQATGPTSVQAVATAGPSGVAGIACSVNGAAATWYPTASTSIWVSQPGVNTLSCQALNNAVDESGKAGSSGEQTWSVDIRKPTVSLISVAHVANALRCQTSHRHVRLAAHWITVLYQGHPVRERVPAQTRTIKSVRCHPRVETVKVQLGGRTVTERIVELPHRVAGKSERVAFGHRAQVSGWLGTPGGEALGDQLVAILTAPADGRGSFKVVRHVRTEPNGSWTAEIGPGPSRLIEAAYSGNPQLAPATSSAASVAVPASVSLSVSPTRTNWGQTIVISGRLRGGYIPSSGELVVLRIGWSGGSAEIGHVYTNRRGVFRTTYTFLRGTGSESYRIWAQTARESDYPYAPAASRRVPIEVGP